MAVEPQPKPKPEEKKDEQEKKEPELKLDPPLQEFVDERKRLELKRAAAVAAGVDAQQLADIDAVLKKLAPEIGKALIAEVEREAKALAEAARKLVKGPLAAPVPPPEPGEDQKRIKKGEEELKRIEDKLAKAAELGVPDVTLRPVRNRLPRLREELGRAAREAAEREADALREEIDRIARGLPEPDAGDGKGPGPVPAPSPAPSPAPGPTPAPAPGGGGGGSSGGAQPAAGQAKAPPADTSQTETAKAKAALAIYVRSERGVWAWSRSDQAWIPHAFATKLVDVKLISGGILAIAEDEAVLFDSFFGRWLAPLKVSGDVLVKGEASTETKPETKTS